MKYLLYLSLLINYSCVNISLWLEVQDSWFSQVEVSFDEDYNHKIYITLTPYKDSKLNSLWSISKHGNFFVWTAIVKYGGGYNEEYGLDNSSVSCNPRLYKNDDLLTEGVCHATSDNDNECGVIGSFRIDPDDFYTREAMINSYFDILNKGPGKYYVKILCPQQGEDNYISPILHVVE